jgi:hypothetical protein
MKTKRSRRPSTALLCHVLFRREFLERLDVVVARRRMTRSAFVRWAVEEHLARVTEGSAA